MKHLVRATWLIAVVVTMIACAKEKGCTNPNATNYNPIAQVDDGSCALHPSQVTCGYNVPPVQGLVHDFSDVDIDNTDYSNPQWLNINQQGNRFWRGRVSNQNSGNFVQATGFDGQGLAVPPTEIWFVSPPVLTSNQPVLFFNSAQAFWTHSTTQPFRVFISIDYDGCAIDEANWIEITDFSKPNSSTGNYQWVFSGEINLVSILPQGYTGTFHVGFRYYSEGNQTTTIRIKDIVIQ